MSDLNQPAAIFWWVVVPVFALLGLYYVGLLVADRRRSIRKARQATLARRNYVSGGDQS